MKTSLIQKYSWPRIRQRKLWIAVSLVCGVLVASGVLAFFQQSSLAEITAKAQFNERRGLFAARLAGNALQCRRYEKDSFLNIGDESTFHRYLEKWRESYRALHDDITLLVVKCELESERQMVADWKAAAVAYRSHFLSVIDEIERGKITTAEMANATMTLAKNSVR